MEYFLNFVGIKKQIDIRKLLNLPKNNENYSLNKFRPVNNNLKQRLIKDIFYNSLPALLRYEDKNSMRFSIEGRVPYLDFELVRLIFSLQESDIIQYGKNKFFLRWLMEDLLPKEIISRRDKIGFTTPEKHWFYQLKKAFFDVFTSESFAGRKYFNQKEVLLAFNDFLSGKNDESMLFWRLFNLEIWLRIFFDTKAGRNEESDYYPNKGKKLMIKVDSKEYLRYPIKTKVFQKDDNLIDAVKKYGCEFSKKVNLEGKKYFLVVSEKIVAIAQGRSFFIWEIKPSLLARILSIFVKKTPYGIGLGSPWTMQLAIKEAGILRIIFAVIIAAIGKIFKISGLFYIIAGADIASIDGPTEYSVFPSNVSAKLPPKNPQQVAKKIDLEIKKSLSGNFIGTVIIDANDLGQKVLANTTLIPDKLVEDIFKDNPMGQAKEKTPLVMVVFNH
jgi:asparagine synthase (glutamine-hydrolysing)